MLQSGGIISTPSRISRVVQPRAPARTPASLCCMPFWTLSATPLTRIAWTQSPRAMSPRSTSITFTGTSARKARPARVMVMPVCLICTISHSSRVLRMRRMLPSPTPTDSARRFLPTLLPSERMWSVQ